jgi:hypothetical protein
MLSAEDAAEYQQRTIATAELTTGVPEQVQQAFERLRTLHSHGLLCYDAFTAVIDLAPRVADLAVRQRFVDFHSNSVEVFDALGVHGLQPFNTVEELTKELKRRRARIKGWPKSERFTGGFSQLLRWARRVGLVSGQRARHAEKRLAEWRNLLAHPDGHHVQMPVDSARAIHDLAEFINRLWGVRTPGGRLYPAPAHRDVLALAYTAEGEMSVGLAESLQFHPSLENSTILIVRGDRDDEGLFEYDALYENTRIPTDLLWGPGTYRAAARWLDASNPRPDTVDHLDRCFVIGGQDEACDRPRSANVVAALPRSEQEGLWSAIRADTPLDAFTHVRGGHEPFLGPCEMCAAEGLGRGNWQDTLRAVSSSGYVIAAATPGRARMPGRWAPRA